MDSENKIADRQTKLIKMVEEYKVREYKRKNAKKGQKSIQLPSNTLFNEDEEVIVISKKEFHSITEQIRQLEEENRLAKTKSESDKEKIKEFDKIKKELEIYVNENEELKGLNFNIKLLNKDIERLEDKIKLLEKDNRKLEEEAINNENTFNELSTRIKETTREINKIKTENINKKIAINYYQSYINSLFNRGLYARIINKKPTSKFPKPDYVEELEQIKGK